MNWKLIAFQRKEKSAEVLISYSLQGGKEVTVKKNVTLKPGLNKIHIPLDIQNPVRWMPNGWENLIYMISQHK